jgi:hypothetical protein
MRVGYWWKSRRKEATARTWVDNIKIDLREIGWKSIDWILLAPDMNHWTVL